MAYVDLTARFTYGLALFFGEHSKLANNDVFLKDNGWQDGTVGVFFQAAAPTGWTKLTTVNDQAVRVVSGFGGGVGGSVSPASGITLAHTHAVSTDGTHTHTLQDHTAYLATSGTEKATGASVIPIIGLTDTESGIPPKSLNLRIVSGAVFQNVKKNQLAMTGGPYATGSGGSHTHGGVTTSALSDISLAYMDVIFCSKDTSSGYTDLSATFVHNTREVFDYFEQLSQNDNYNYQRSMPAATVSLFVSATSPTGWTKQTSQNARLLRVVSGSGGGTGGTTDPASTITLAHTHGNLSSDGAHTHSIPGHKMRLGDDSQILAVGGHLVETLSGQLRDYTTTAGNGQVKSEETGTDGSGTSSSDGSHQHATGSALADISLAYLNVIQASKDSAGAPAAYTDMRGFFLDQDLLAYQDLQKMANNDAYLNYHTMPSGGVMFFFQSSAPLNWTKLTTNNDAFLRIVSDGSGGASGGSAPLSVGLTLVHAHSLDTKSHSHSMAHTHDLDTLNTTINAQNTAVANTRIFGAHGAQMYRDTTGGAGDTALGQTTESVTVTTDSVDHNHGASTGSALSNVALAYADVIMCQKN